MIDVFPVPITQEIRVNGCMSDVFAMRLCHDNSGTTKYYDESTKEILYSIQCDDGKILVIFEKDKFKKKK